MAKKHVFSKAEKWAVYTASDGHCFWCARPLDYRDCTVDHVIPETLLERPDELAQIIRTFALGPDFQVNEFGNWVPAHQACNRTKSTTVFAVSPAMMLLLEQVRKRAIEARAIFQTTVTTRKVGKLLGELEVMLESGKVAVEQLLELIKASAAPQSQSLEGVQASADDSADDVLHFAGWAISKRTGDVAYVTKDERGGYTYVGTGHNIDFMCPNCHQLGPWSGARCLTCGVMSDPWD